MTTVRTKQQIAFDGVRVAWQRDTFTQILHSQVATKFSMDGVVPNQDTSVVCQGAPVRHVAEPVQSTETAQKRMQRFVGNMDGVRMPFGQLST